MYTHSIKHDAYIKLLKLLEDTARYAASAEAFFALRGKKTLIMLFWPIFGDFWFPVVTLVTFSSNLSNFQKSPTNPKKIPKKPKISKNLKNPKKSKKNNKVPKNFKNAKNLKIFQKIQKNHFFSKKSENFENIFFSTKKKKMLSS